MNPPAYWQLRTIRAMWPDQPLATIARRVKAGKSTLIAWRNDGLLDPLPERNITRGRPMGKRTSKPRPTHKLTAAPLTVEPLTECQPCKLCEYERVCRERASAGLWCCCETPDARALEVARAQLT